MHFGFATQNMSSDYWLIVTYGAQQRATKLGIDITTLSATTLDQQLAAMHTFIDQRVDVLLLGAVTSTGYAEAIERARQAGIPVVAVSSLLRGCTVTCSVRPDHMHGAELAAEYIAEQLGGFGTVAHLIGPENYQESVDRAIGVHKVFDQYPGIQVVFEEQSPDWNAQFGSAIIGRALKRHPNLDAVCAANDTLALGAVDAIAGAGRTGEVVVTGFDATPEALVALQEGRISATVQTSMLVIGGTAIETAARLARGEKVPPIVFSDLSLVTRSNLVNAALESVAILPTILRNAVERGEALARADDEIIRAQATLLQELSSPLIPISDAVMVMPLIGTINAARAQQIMETLLHGISANSTKVIILDITGVPLVDTYVANVLINAARAVQLLGAQLVLTGIGPEVAQTLVSLGVDLKGVMTRSTVQSGIAYALKRG